MNAYDYENQKWVTGREGAIVAARDIREEINLYSGPDAEHARAMIASPRSVVEILAGLRANLATALAEATS